MDFNSYYLNQATGEYPVFRGSPYQRGYGLGGIFRRFFTWVFPILKEHGLPIAKNVGKELITNAANIATDALEGRDLKSSVEDKLRNSLDKLNQKGSGFKRKNFLSSINMSKRKLKKSFEKKRKYFKKGKDIFN